MNVKVMSGLPWGLTCLALAFFLYDKVNNWAFWSLKIQSNPYHNSHQMNEQFFSTSF